MVREAHKPEHWNPGVRFGLGLSLVTACFPGLIPAIPKILWLIGFIAGAMIMVQSAIPFYLEQRKEWAKQAKKMFALYGMMVCGIGFFVFAILYGQLVLKSSSSVDSPKTNSTTQESESPPSFRTVFERDYLGEASLVREVELNNNIGGLSP